MKKYILLSGAWLLLTQATTPPPFCSCNDNGPFLKVAPSAILVSLVKVTKYLTFKDIYDEKTPMSMEVEILDIYKGKEKRRSVTVWGDPGNLCRPYLSVFKEGGYYIIAFDQAGKQAIEIKTDYAISVCGTFWLTVDHTGKIATGNIDSNKKSAALEEIKYSSPKRPDRQDYFYVLLPGLVKPEFSITIFSHPSKKYYHCILTEMCFTVNKSKWIFLRCPK